MTTNLRYTAIIDGDAVAAGVTTGCHDAKAAALAARRYAHNGETITIVGPRGGVSQWRAVGGDTGGLGNVRRIGSKPDHIFVSRWVRRGASE